MRTNQNGYKLHSGVGG